MLIRTTSIIKKIIKGRPSVQYFNHKYRGYELWYNDHNTKNHKTIYDNLWYVLY